MVSMSGYNDGNAGAGGLQAQGAGFTPARPGYDFASMGMSRKNKRRKMANG